MTYAKGTECGKLYSVRRLIDSYLVIVWLMLGGNPTTS
jgi:hypothetical protein